MFDAKKKRSGSLKNGEPEFVVVGKIRRPHGVHGDVLVEVFPIIRDQLVPQRSVYLGSSFQKATISHLRTHHNGILLRFFEYSTPESIGMYRNQHVYVKSADIPEHLEGDFYDYELHNMLILDETGKQLGVLTDIIKTGANDVYVVTTSDGKEILLPAISEVIKAVDMEAREITIHLIPGLIE
jgi:16S rRNA processing protein RimM